MRTTSELNDSLSRERIWRIRECSSILDLAGRSTSVTVQHGIYLRAGAVLYYSHWEGFVKRAATYYLKHVALQRISLAQMCPSILRLFMKQQLLPTATVEKWEKLGDRLLNDPTYAPKLSHKAQIDTASNLSSHVFGTICSTIGMSSSNFTHYYAEIDSLLLKNRNSVAHGEQNPEFYLADLEKSKELVIALITLFKDEIENLAALRSYRI